MSMETEIDMTRAAHGAAPARNDAWIRGEVADAARLLRERNLAHADEVAAPVHPKRTIYGRFVKRGLDIALSAAALAVTAPVNLVLAGLTYLDVGSPVLFRQRRQGRGLSEFTMVKFRNMTNDTDADGQLLPVDQRITKLGYFVRNHSLDELLNFWSVLKGDMSLIGPRPLPVEFTERMTERHKMRYVVRPGLECPAMSERPEGVDPAHFRFENDVAYVESLSFMTDVKQAFRLVAVVFRRAGSSPYTGTDGHFIGYDRDGRAMSQGRLKDPAAYRREVLGAGE